MPNAVYPCPGCGGRLESSVLGRPNRCPACSTGSVAPPAAKPGGVTSRMKAVYIVAGAVAVAVAVVVAVALSFADTEHWDRVAQVNALADRQGEARQMMGQGRYEEGAVIYGKILDEMAALDITPTEKDKSLTGVAAERAIALELVSLERRREEAWGAAGERRYDAADAIYRAILRVCDQDQSDNDWRYSFRERCRSEAMQFRRDDLLACRTRAAALLTAGKATQAAALYRELLSRDFSAFSVIEAKELRTKIDPEYQKALYLERLQTAIEGVRTVLQRDGIGPAETHLRELIQDGPEDPLKILPIVADCLNRAASDDKGDHGALLDRIVTDLGVWIDLCRSDMLKSYQLFRRDKPSSPFGREAARRIVDVRVKLIMKRKHRKFTLPEEQQPHPSRGHSVVNVFNDTPYTLTLLYSGVESFEAVFASKEKGSIEFRNGHYTVVVTGQSTRLWENGGQHDYGGADYAVHFVMDRAGAPTRSSGTKRPKGSPLPPFEQWTPKRRTGE